MLNEPSSKCLKSFNRQIYSIFFPQLYHNPLVDRLASLEEILQKWLKLGLIQWHNRGENELQSS